MPPPDPDPDKRKGRRIPSLLALTAAVAIVVIVYMSTDLGVEPIGSDADVPAGSDNEPDAVETDP